MATLSKGTTYTDGMTVTHGNLNALVDSATISGIVNADIDAGAAIAPTKLAQITTASKVSGTALTGLASIPAGAGVIPVANLGSGTPGATNFLRGDGAFEALTTAELPAGTVLQVVNVQSGAVATGTTAMPYDDTIPQKTEGDEYMTLAITPSSATNKLLIKVVFCAAHSSGSYSVALFQDDTANALAATYHAPYAADVLCSNELVYYMAAGTTSATTFKVRAGGGATLTFNGVSGARKFGGAIQSSITITEIKA